MLGSDVEGDGQTRVRMFPFGVAFFAQQLVQSLL